MKRFVLLNIFLLILLAACNPKPQVKTTQKEEIKYTKIDHEKNLFHEETIFKEYPIFEGLERISQYYGGELKEQDQKRITKFEDFHTISMLDMLKVLDERNIFIYPTYGNETDILEGLKQNKPILIKFSPIGNQEIIAIFYGYSKDQLLYYDVNSHKEREITHKQLSEAVKPEKQVSFYIPFKEGEGINKKRLDSKFFNQLAISDAYYKGDKALFKESIKQIEKNKWENDFSYFYAYYYLFYEEDVKKAEAMLKQMNGSSDPLKMELQLKLYKLQGNNKELKNIVSKIQVMPQFRTETLEEIRLRAEKYGYDKIVENVESILKDKQKN
ncbi:hypothetical protein ACQKP0_21840 [Heyndrickxia sp. NPDC080065]|uniref:hypothetical protein n=1 Tax=Heyndrickxia sp. NPDC080065 TaxID=3390568 RepID=UPI003CFC7CE9